MLKTSVFILFLVAVIVGPSLSAQVIEAIPKTATVLETQTVTSKRKLILWMPDPKKHPNESEADDIYTCPDQTRGSYYSGVVRVTLMNSLTNKAINTLKVKSDPTSEPDTKIDIPYLIRAGFYYKVPDPSSKIERKPQIMALKDYNGNGKAHEFVLFDAWACMGLGTTLIGYSEKSDQVIQYAVLLKTPEGEATQYWVDYLFSKKSTRPGVWRYDIDYRGRGGTMDRYTIRYDGKREQFFGGITRQQ